MIDASELTEADIGRAVIWQGSTGTEYGIITDIGNKDKYNHIYVRYPKVGTVQASSLSYLSFAEKKTIKLNLKTK